jgi:asparagine synthase (glutamine-hydrolysing)
VLRELLLSRASRQRGIIEPAYAERLITRHEAGRPLDMELWALMSFELWCRRFLDAPSPRPIAIPGEPPDGPRRRPVAAPHGAGLSS